MEYVDQKKANARHARNDNSKTHLTGTPVAKGDMVICFRLFVSRSLRDAKGDHYVVIMHLSVST